MSDSTEAGAVPASRREGLAEIVTLARNARHVVLTTHVNADGDGAGSQAAMAAWLESIGVRATILNPTPFPDAFRFLLHRQDLVVELTDDAASQVLASAELALVLDTSEANRIRPLDQVLGEIPTYVIDHHPPGPSVVGKGGVQDPTAAAAGELVYDLITLSGDPWPEAAVLGCYVAIVSDTGSFRFSNTTPRTHLIASDLLTRGVDAEWVFQRLFAVASTRQLELLREALGRLEHDPELGIAWMAIPAEIPERIGAVAEDFEGLIDHARSLEGTRVALLLRGMPEGDTKISLRSTGPIDVNRIARQIGGGGHAKAAGARLGLPLDEAVGKVMEVVRDELAQQDG